MVGNDVYRGLPYSKLACLPADGRGDAVHRVRYVRVADTVRGFRMILDGEVDHIPEPLFYMAGAIEDVLARFETYEA